MELVVYPLLNKGSQRAIKRTHKSYGRPYRYAPQLRLVRRLSKELGKTEEQIRKQIEKERKFLLEYKRYF